MPDANIFHASNLAVQEVKKILQNCGAEAMTIEQSFKFIYQYKDRNS
jgi:hypothetical protein